MHNFVVHSNDSACRKNGCLGMDQVLYPAVDEVSLHMYHKYWCKEDTEQWDIHLGGVTCTT